MSQAAGACHVPGAVGQAKKPIRISQMYYNVNTVQASEPPTPFCMLYWPEALDAVPSIHGQHLPRDVGSCWAG